MGKKKLNRDLALKVLAEVGGVKDALADLMDTMFIIYEPKDWSVVETGTNVVTFTVKAMNVASYQWQRSDTDGASWTNATSTGNRTESMSFTATSSYASRVWSCVLTDADGNTIRTHKCRVIFE